MKPSISTHVLDLARGEPARDVRVDLYKGNVLISTQQTNTDGRIPDLLRGTLEQGTYRLIFHVASPFFTRFEAEFAIADVARHYHIPLLVSPYGCTTYRGS